jgi:hypothetical protein
MAPRLLSTKWTGGRAMIDISENRGVRKVLVDGEDVTLGSLGHETCVSYIAFGKNTAGQRVLIQGHYDRGDTANGDRRDENVVSFLKTLTQDLGDVRIVLNQQGKKRPGEAESFRQVLGANVKTVTAFFRETRLDAFSSGEGVGFVLGSERLPSGENFFVYPWDNLETGDFDLAQDTSVDGAEGTEENLRKEIELLASKLNKEIELDRIPENLRYSLPVTGNFVSRFAAKLYSEETGGGRSWDAFSFKDYHPLLTVVYEGKVYVVDFAWKKFVPLAARGKFPDTLICEISRLETELTRRGVPPSLIHVWWRALQESTDRVGGVDYLQDRYLKGSFNLKRKVAEVKRQEIIDLRRGLTVPRIIDRDTGERIGAPYKLRNGAFLYTPLDFTALKGQRGVIVHDHGEYSLEYSREWVEATTSLSFFGKFTGFYGYLEKFLKGRNPKDPLVIMDWGCGEGQMLLDLKKELHRRGFNSVRLIGYSDEYYSSWQLFDSSFTFIWDLPGNLLNHIQSGQVDIILSRQGLGHLLEHIAEAYGGKGETRLSKARIGPYFDYLRSLLHRMKPGGFFLNWAKTSVFSVWGKPMVQLPGLAIRKTGDNDLPGEMISAGLAMTPTGGIDLNAAMAPETRGAAGMPATNLHPTGEGGGNILGLEPVLIGIRPLDDLPQLLGLPAAQASVSSH